MGISVTCSVCQRTFVDIDPSMLGQKARCSCGTVVLLVADEALEEPELIEELELLDDDDLVLAPIENSGNAQSGPSRLPTSTPAGSSGSNGKIKKSTSLQSRKPSRSDQASNPTQNSRREKAIEPIANLKEEIPDVELMVPEVPLQLNEPTTTKNKGLRHPKQNSSNPSKQSKRPKTDSSKDRNGTSKPTRSKKEARPRRESPKPLMADSFADVDAILNGGVDASPLAPRRKNAESTRPPHAPSQDSRRPNAPARPLVKSLQQDDPVALGQDAPDHSFHFTSLISLAGGAIGVLFGVIALITRQTPFKETPLGWLGEPMFGMYQAAYGSGAVEGIFQSLFVGLGWLLIAVAFSTLVISIFLALRGVVRMIIGKGVFGWSRGLSAIVGVVGLFTITAILFTQYAHHDHLQSELNRMDGGVVGLVQDLENVKIIREQYVAENQRFSFAMMFLAAMPGTLFLAAIINLFFDRD